VYVDEYSISGEQVRAARALLRVDQKQIALAAGVSVETIKRLEAVEGPINVTSRTLSALRNAFLKFGVVFDGREDADLAVGWARRDRGAMLRSAIPRPRRARYEPAPLTRLLFWSKLPDDTGIGAGLSKGPGKGGVPRGLKPQLHADVTGAELEHAGYRMQALEGPTDLVLAMFGTLRDEGVHDEATLIQSRTVTGRLFDSWSVLGDDPHLVEDILFKDGGLSVGFHPRDLSPAAVLGLFILLLVSQTPHRR
jgi:transcriptional regulator with XRE-family HTH domain